ncbi:MAG: undecaprenyl-phosphate glucose phosphotransferase [Alphaproteobacteria bacterium]|nr:undecaprenyl-phosphate glucose phosphotransferase [Alphaproteobacteria bacterium]MBO6861165.1 undecaprenyl-phosphate glucose phosphotransferase [Alphaproteobacteria bacterium]
MRYQERRAVVGSAVAGGLNSLELSRVKPTQEPISRKQIARTLALTDFGLVLTLAPVAYAATSWNGSLTGFSAQLPLVLLAAVLTVSLCGQAGTYEPRKVNRPGMTVLRATLSWVAAALSVFAVGIVSGSLVFGWSPWLAGWFGAVLVSLSGTRVVFSALATRWALEGRLGERVAIIGDPLMVRRLSGRLTRSEEGAAQIVGLYSDRSVGRTSLGAISGDCDDLLADLRTQPVNAVIIAVPEGEDKRVAALRERLLEAPVDVRLCPGGHALLDGGYSVAETSGVPLMEVGFRPLAGWRRVVKEIEDRVIGLVITLMIAPVLLGIAVAIKLDSRGPVFFKQRRTGYNNQLIEVLKFRTMYVEDNDADGVRLTQRNDPRVTRVGGVLRRWSLDELPQFLNVLRGDMSIVGPRPHALLCKAGGKYYRDAVPGYDARHRVKPGITGLAQIRGWRGPTETERQIRKRVEYDIRYIENWSLWLDLKIILVTAFTGFKSENAF